MAESEQWHTTEEIAVRYHTTPSTVAQWRYLGKGPRGVRFGKRVLYAESDLRAWEAEQRDKQPA